MEQTCKSNGRKVCTMLSVLRIIVTIALLIVITGACYTLMNAVVFTAIEYVLSLLILSIIVGAIH